MKLSFRRKTFLARIAVCGFLFTFVWAFFPQNLGAQRWGGRFQQPSNLYPSEPSNAPRVQGTAEPANPVQGADTNAFHAAFQEHDVFPVTENPDLKPFLGIVGSHDIVALSIREIVDGIEGRGLNGRYNQWRGYVQATLARTNAVKTGSEVNGLGRLEWYRTMMADPLRAAAEAEAFSKTLHVQLCSGRAGFCQALALCGEKLDLNASSLARSEPFSNDRSVNQAVATLIGALEDAKIAHAEAIVGLSKAELTSLNNYANSVFTVQASVGHTVNNRGTARQLVLHMEKIDRLAMMRGLADLSILMDKGFIRTLDRVSESTAGATLEGVSGTIVRVIETQAGLLVVGGRDNNVYDLEKMKNVCCIVDLGGDDTYIEGVCNLQRPVLAILDLHGDDTYRGVLPGIQGSSFLGISMLVDAGGNDTYTAKYHAQGSTIGGACALIDMDGNDRYHGVRRVQGTALVGFALLLDRRGNDDYHAAMWSQGMGQTYGCGILEDCTGDDHYYTGGLYADSYPETPGYEGWGQGLGTGIRGVAAGGIGILLEGAGDDTYEYDYIAHGGGYWMGIGILRDFGGDDRHEGGTLTMFDGSPRRERKFQRFSSGFGCHYAPGFFFDDAGDDRYWASIMSEGFAWDCGVAFHYDFTGNDTVTATGAGNQGQGAQASLGVMVNYSGDDTYKGSSQGYASGNIDYHQLPACGGNFSFFMDYAGNDSYGSRVKNNSIVRRGTSGGYMIDRPSQEEYESMVKE